MPVETIGADDGVEALNENWPDGSEPVKQGDDHLRNIKKAVKNQERVNSARNYGAINPNMLINGDFSVWQRGNSFTGFVYGCDRWVGYNAAVTRQWEAVKGTVLKAVRSDIADGILITQPVELLQTGFGISVKPFVQGKEYTLSAHVGTTGKLKPEIWYGEGAVAPTGGVTDDTFAFQSPDSDGYVSFTFTVDHLPATDDLCVLISFKGEGTGVEYNFYSAKLEIGSVRTEHVPDLEQVNLAKCQRYYEVIPGGAGYAYNTTSSTIALSFKVSKRTSAYTVFEYGQLFINAGSTSGSGTGVTSVSGTFPTKDGCNLTAIYGTYGVQYRPTVLHTKVDGHGVAIDAEL